MGKHSADKYDCFQWIRDIRAEMTRDMEGMTPEERSSYINNRYEEAKKGRPQYTLAESRQLLDKYLSESTPSQALKAVKKPSARLKTTKRLAHA